MKYEQKIPLEVKYIRIICEAIPNAYFLHKQQIDENNFPTTNGKELYIWNYINKNISDNFPTDKFQVIVMKRGSWAFIGIYDKEEKYLYTLMREKNLANLQKNINANLIHYSNALSKLNDPLKREYEPVAHQISLFGEDLYDTETDEKLDDILHKIISKVDSEIIRYVLIAFDSDSVGNIKDIKGIIPAKGLDIYKEENWVEYVSQGYDITDIVTSEYVQAENEIMLERKPNLKRKIKQYDKEKINE